MTNRYPGGLVRRTAANTSITGASGVWDLGSQAQAVRTNTWPISGLANPVSGSLRFRSSASAYLSKTWGSNGNSQTFTVSVWVKRGSLGSIQSIVTARQNGLNNLSFRFPANDTLEVYAFSGGSLVTNLITTQVFRDSSAWYHLVLAVDTTQATSSNRVKFYVNGTQITTFGTATYPSLSATTLWNQTAATHYLGTYDGSSELFDGYMAEVNVIGGQQLTPSSFGQTSPITGVWEPIKYTGTYGTNGFYLSLSDTSSIGKDFSGNGNNWTPNNISTTNDSTFDLMRDVPTQWAPQGVTDVGGVVRGNYATFNPLVKFNSTPTFSEGSLKITSNAGNYQVGVSTIGIPQNSGKWYWETTASGTMSSGTYSGIMNNAGIRSMTVNSDYVTLYGYGTSTYSSGSGASNNYYYYAPNTSLEYSPSVIWNSGDTICWAYDSDNGRMWIGRNGVWNGNNSGVVGNPSTGSNPLISSIPSETWYPAMGVYQHPSLGTTAWFANFGQRAFAYTVPTGFKALCTTNLPTPTIGATAANAANKYFDATLITGTAATQVITNAGGFQPDFVWLKSRTNANNPTIYDAIRGVNTILYPALTNAEQVGTAQLTAFNSNGFTLGASENANDQNGEASVGWQWNAGGSTVTNTAGSISSQVRANPTAGFSIVTWTGTGTNRPSIGHGLGVAPAMIIEKGRDAGTGPYAWTVQHSGLSSWNNSLFLNNSNAENSGSGGGTAPSSTVYYAAANNYSGENGVRYVAYCFAPVAGYSAFGKYTGNGSTDGPFVYTGFRPRYVMVKNTVDPNNWTIFDTARNTYNIIDLQIYPTSDAEVAGGSSNGIDFLSNGFKLRSSNNWGNRAGDNIIYMAFAEHPFKNALAR